MMMDIQTGLIYVGIVLFIAVVLFAISFLGIKEKTYEEAIAEQRNLPNEHLLLGRSGKDKSKEKKLKKAAGKKVKEKPAERETTNHSKIGEGPASTHEKGHVEFVEPEAAIMSVQHPPEEKKKKKKVKPILLNKDEHPVFAEACPPSKLANHFEESLPKDELLLKRAASKEDLHKTNVDTAKAVSTKAVASSKGSSKVEKSLPKPEKIVLKTEKVLAPKSEKITSSKGEKTVAMKVEKPLPAKEEKIVATKVDKVEKTSAPKVEKVAVPKVEKEAVGVDLDEPIPIPASVISKEQRNKKKKSELATLQQMSGDREGVNVSLIVPLVQKAELSRSEIQILIDLLLNKQQGSAISNAEWIEGRQDPMVKLKKQLAEKEKALSEEQEASQAFQSKLKELRSELNTERSRLTHSCRQLEETVTTKQAETQLLTTRLQHAIDTHAVEKQALAQQVQQLQAKLSEDHLLLRKLQEEQGQTQGVLQQELLSQRQQLELHIAHLSEQHQEADSSYKNQLNQLHGQLHEQEGINATLNVEVQSLRENIMTRDGDNKILRDQISHLETEIMHHENHTQDMARQMEELQRFNANLEHRVRCESALKYEYENLRKEYDTMNDAYSKVAEIQNESGRLRSENDKMVAAMKELQSESQHAKDEKEKLSSKLSETLKDSQQLREENESLAAQVTAVTERPAAEGRENGDVPEEKPVQKEENSLEKIVQQKEAELEKLSSELNTFKTEFRKVNEELEAQRKKNNALRSRNWNAMEAISSAEKSLENHMKESQKLVSETSNAVRLEEQKITKQILLRIFPDIKVEEKTVHTTWVERFEGAAKTFLTELKSRPQASSPVKATPAELNELQAQNKKLESMVEHYKTIIHDTEKLLNQLQANAEEEETRWRAQLKKREAEMEILSEEKKSLELSLDQLKGAEQMQTKLQELQDKLHSEEIENRNLAKQYEMMRSQLAGKGDAPDMSAVVEKLNEEKTQLGYALQSAQEKERELSKELAKLKSLVQIGQDSLNQEQQISQQLKSQVDKLNGVSQNHSVATNGAATESSISEGGSGKK